MVIGASAAYFRVDDEELLQVFPHHDQVHRAGSVQWWAHRCQLCDGMEQVQVGKNNVSSGHVLTTFLHSQLKPMRQSNVGQFR